MQLKTLTFKLKTVNRLVIETNRWKSTYDSRYEAFFCNISVSMLRPRLECLEHKVIVKGTRKSRLTPSTWRGPQCHPMAGPQRGLVPANRTLVAWTRPCISYKGQNHLPSYGISFSSSRGTSNTKDILIMTSQKASLDSIQLFILEN